MPKRPSLLAFAVAALLPLSLAQSARAQEHTQLDDPYIAADLSFGLGGSATFGSDLGDVTHSMKPTFGFAGRYVYPLHAYFAVGGSLGVASWRSTSESSGGRNLLFDLHVLPTGKFAITRELEVFASVPIGLGLDSWNEIDAQGRDFGPLAQALGTSIQGDTALGFTVGVLAGVRYQLIESVGLLAELGYLHHSFSHKATGSLLSRTVSEDVSVSFGQFALNLGAYF